jgi:DNA-binding IclR family transcriptional regulator
VSRKRAPEGTQAVIRAVGLLKAFTRERPELSLAELSAGMGLTKTTTHRLLAALEAEDLVARNPATRAFRLGPGVLALGSLAMISNSLRAVVDPELRRLAEATGEAATLEVPSEGKMLVLAEVSGRHLVTVAAELGSRFPIHATSTGKAYLAALPEEERKPLMVAPLSRHTPSTITRIKDLKDELERVRERGYATACEELEPGFSAVGVALANSQGMALGGISLNGPTSRFTSEYIDALAPTLLVLAKRLARSLHMT